MGRGITKGGCISGDMHVSVQWVRPRLIPRPSLTAFTAVKKAVREGLGMRLGWTCAMDLSQLLQYSSLIPYCKRQKLSGGLGTRLTIQRLR